MGEWHAYGASFGCLSRRKFILGLSCIMTMLCILKIGRWLGQCHFLDAMIGRHWPAEHVSGCRGLDCYEVFSCLGMKDATAHLREPLTSLVGAFFFPLGAYGAHHGYRQPVQWLGGFLMVSATLHLGILAADGIFLRTCNWYPRNMLEQTLLQELLPPSPLTPAAQASLKAMSMFPVEDVSQITGGFNILLWYLAIAGPLAAFLTYAAYEAYSLGILLERGPLGLGVHYGIGQWDKVPDQEALRRLKMREMKSQFVDDANLPLFHTDAEAPYGYMLPQSCYGSVKASSMPSKAAQVQVTSEADIQPETTPEVDLEAEAWPAMKAQIATEAETVAWEANRPVKVAIPRKTSYFEEDLYEDDDELDSEPPWEGIPVASPVQADDDGSMSASDGPMDSEELRLLAERVEYDELAYYGLRPEQRTMF